jgi:hypothetical protein
MQSTGQTSTQAVSFVPTHGSQMMYATLMSSKPTKGPTLEIPGEPWAGYQFFLQPRSITRAIAGMLSVAAVLACTDLRSAAWMPADGPSTALRAGWREAPEYVELFAPPARRAAYRAYVSPTGLEATLTQLLADPGVLQPPGAWTPQAMIPYDAFGLSGSYNRWKVAGLYRSRRARVARGPRLEQGRTESWTLIAPYPDVALQRLEPGTLIIVLHVPSD